MTQISKRSSLRDDASLLLSALLGVSLGLTIGLSWQELEGSLVSRSARKIDMRSFSGPGAHLGQSKRTSFVASRPDTYDAARALSIRVAAREKLRLAAPNFQSLSASPLQREDFPAFGRTVHPVSRIPNWGAMRTPAEWERPHDELNSEDFVTVPVYDLSVLTIPLAMLIKPILPQAIPVITAKLYYSTRHFGAYDLDSGEYASNHPGVDLKLAQGTPFGSLAGGRVHAVRGNSRLGLSITVEHRHPTDGIFFSVYGHIERALVTEGQDVSPGQAIGSVGMTGNTSGPHIHLQVDRDTGARPHQPYGPLSAPSREEAERWTVNPMEFIRRYAGGVGG